jgi:hypothetical protein
MELLEELNHYRALDGKVPLKKWTGTDDQLKWAIIDRKKRRIPQKTEEELVAEYHANGKAVHYGPSANAKGVRRQGPRRLRKGKIQDKPKLTAVATKQFRSATTLPADCFHLTEMCPIMDTEEFTARGLARKKPELASMNVPELGRWVFKRTDWDRVGRIVWPKRWR